MNIDHELEIAKLILAYVKESNPEIKEALQAEIQFKTLFQKGVKK